MSIRKVLAGGAAAAVIVAATSLLAAPAQAATSNCPSGAACIWKDLSWQTNGIDAAYVGFQMYIPNYTSWTYNGTAYGANDTATSLYNNGNMSTVTWYRDANKGGWGMSWSIKTGDPDLRDNGANDAISSGYFAGY